MRVRWAVLACVLCLAAGIAVGSWIGGPSPAGIEQETIYQVSTIDTLLQGGYDGVVSFGEVRKHGDFGIATLDGLDGEMIAFDGAFYHIRADGTVVEVTDDMTTPFGTVTYFSPDSRFLISHASNFTDFSRQAEAFLPSRNYPYAVMLRGEFPSVTARAIPRQEKPYPRMVEASANQSVFEFNNTTGTIAGFWTPDLAEGLNVPGFHLHYLNADRTAGGHILDFILENATVEIDTSSALTIVLPTAGTFSGLDLSGDLGSELALVEQGAAGS